MLLGNKPLRAVIDKLRKAKLVKVTNGIPRYLKDEEDNFLDAKKSMFEATAELVSFCRANIRTTSESARNYVELKSKTGNLLEFEPTLYTDHINQLMKRYCEYLNRQTITVDDESIGDIFMARKYKDWKGDGSFQFGGRTHHPYMSFSKAKRSRILINGKKTVGIDYPASVANILYRHITGRALVPDDPYRVNGIPRDIAKQFLNIMLNCEGRNAACQAINKWLKNEANAEQQKSYAKAVSKLGSNAKIADAIAARNQPIKHCFYRGKALGQHYSWLEANIVFEVAHYFTEYLDIPALTIHDEFIIPEEYAFGIEEYLYTVGLDDFIYHSLYVGRK
jgi:hypothetical protein